MQKTAHGDLDQTARSSGAAERVVTVGRGPDNDVILDYPMISWQHAQFTAKADGTWLLEDLHSTNGTAIGHAEHRITRAQVTPDDSVFFGSFKARVSRLIDSEKIVLGNSPQEPLRFTGQQMTIGRDPQCDYPLNYPTLSWQHAKLQRTPEGIQVEDLGSKNGTFVNGQRITQRVVLKPGSEVGLGSIRFTLLDDSGTFAKRDYKGNVTIEASGVVVEIHRRSVNRRLLDPVSFTLYPSELIALMGLAGSGKTTLLKALNGYTPPDSGQVLFNGEDLYLHQDQFRLQIGYVPQDDILHPQLTVRQALYYTAKLRTDLRDSEITARIRQVLTDLGIEDIENREIGSPEKKVISGGQRKRVSIAMELLSDPSVLFLDEPTSGLSSHDASQVINVLRQMANNGKTIITTIHQPSIDIFRQFDSLVMMGRDKGEGPGALVYFGPAYPESIDFFNPGKDAAQRTPEMLMSGLAEKGLPHWTGKYQESPLKKLFVDARKGKIVSSPNGQTASQPKRDFGFGQWLVLSERNARLRRKDEIQTLILLAQAPLFAVLLVITFGRVEDENFTDPASWAAFAGKLASIHFLMVVAAVWFGCNNAARDIVGETTIFMRERMVNLKLPSYVFSKLSVLVAICVIQCTCLLTITYYACNLSGPFLTELAILVTSSIVGAAIGLFISAIAPTTEAAIALLPLVLLPFILLGGGIKPLHEMPKAAQWVASVCPTRWAYEANLLTEAPSRKARLQNPMQQQSEGCQGSVEQRQVRLSPQAARRAASPRATAPPAQVLSDVAEPAFPVSEGRSSLHRSLQVLITFFGVLLIATLSALSRKTTK